MASSPTTYVASGLTPDFPEPYAGAVLAVTVDGTPVSFTTPTPGEVHLAAAPTDGQLVSVIPAPDFGATSGQLTAIPAGSTNGTPIGTMPSGAYGVRLYVPAATTLTYAIKTAQPVAAPTPVEVLTGANNLFVDEMLANGEMVYVTAITGAPLFRWLLRQAP